MVSDGGAELIRVHGCWCTLSVPHTPASPRTAVARVGHQGCPIYNGRVEQRQMEYREWVVTARRDPDDGHVYVTAHTEGKASIRSVAIQGLCGKFVMTHWRESRNVVVSHPELRLRTLDWLEREYSPRVAR